MPTRKLLDRYVERYNAGDLDGVIDLYADDAVQNMPDGTFVGRDAIRDRLAQELLAFPDVNHTVRSFVEGDAFCRRVDYSLGHTRVRCCCRTAASWLLPACGSRSGAWSSAGWATKGSSSSTPWRQPLRPGAARACPGGGARVTPAVSDEVVVATAVLAARR